MYHLYSCVCWRTQTWWRGGTSHMHALWMVCSYNACFNLFYNFSAMTSSESHTIYQWLFLKRLTPIMCLYPRFCNKLCCYGGPTEIACIFVQRISSGTFQNCLSIFSLQLGSICMTRSITMYLITLHFASYNWFLHVAFSKLSRASATLRPFCILNTKCCFCDGMRVCWHLFQMMIDYLSWGWLNKTKINQVRY